MAERPDIPRVVKPRKPYDLDLPIIAVTSEEIFIESTGELLSRELLAPTLEHHASALIVCSNPERLLTEVHRELSHHPLWQFRLSPLLRERMGQRGEIETRQELIVNFFGFKRPNHHKGSQGRYFYPLAPSQYCRRSTRDLIPGDMPFWQALLTWAEGVRVFCQAHKLRATPTAGGVAAQLLRHPDFYPADRRKAPTATNEKTRPHLPGNHYELRAELDRIYGGALYIDQADAHHFAAESIALPHADDLYAQGRFHQLDGEPWLRPERPGWDSVLSSHGLFHACLEVPPIVANGRYIPPALHTPGPAQRRYVFSNELPELLALGARIRWISAAWTSHQADEGIRKYAEWAKREIQLWPDQKPWLKPTLLASYGILAAKPRRLTLAFWQATGGEEETWPVASDQVDVKVTRTKRAMQSPIANVIQRGMIEAETRRRSLSLARLLEEKHGREVLSVYADAVIVRDRKGDPPGLPLLPEPWRVKDRLSMLRFYSPQAFVSDQIRRLPGVSSDILKASQRETTKGQENE